MPGLLPHLSLNLSGTRVWPLYSICESGRQAIVSLHHQPSCQIMSTTYHEINIISSKPHNITVNGNNSNSPLPDSIRSPRDVPPMPLHPQGPKPCTLNETESIASVYSNSKTSCHQSWRIIIKVKWFIIIKIQITCEQVSSKNKFCQCTRAGCYTGDFVEIAPFFGVLLCLPVTLLFLCLGLVFGRLFVRAVFVILRLLQICRPKLPFVVVLKFLLDFNSISISSTRLWDV